MSFDSSSALIGCTNDYRGNKGVGSNTSTGFPNNQQTNSRDVVCYYCRKLGHTKRECKRLLNMDQRVVSTSNNLDKSISISLEEFAKFQVYQESLTA